LKDLLLRIDATLSKPQELPSEAFLSDEEYDQIEAIVKERDKWKKEHPE